jgi:hypothetical protein
MNTESMNTNKIIMATTDMISSSLGRCCQWYNRLFFFAKVILIRQQTTPFVYQNMTGRYSKLQRGTSHDFYLKM